MKPSTKSAARPPEAMTARVLENAVVRLLKTHPFYGQFLLGFRRREVVGDKALGVTFRNGIPTLCFNPERLASFEPAQQRALLEHVIKHVLHLHMLRRKERNSHDWDLACDLAINPGIADLPLQAALPKRLRLEEGLAAEEYYRLLERPFDTGNQQGQGLGNAEQDAGEHAEAGNEELAPALNSQPQIHDDHQVWQESDSTPVALAEQVVRDLVQDAWRKSHGEVPGDVRELVEGLLAPSPIPWKQVLRQFVATAGRVGRQSTWKREHRRFAHETPGQRKRRRLNLLVGIDVSDSTNIRELRETFARELLNIARGRDSHLTVLYAGSRVQRIDSFRSSAAVVEVYEGGGFTDLRPVFDYARTMQPPPAAVIYLTDGYGEAPATMAYPTLWVLTRDGKKPAPWGVELRLDG
ncbi:VWA-like domain-containing protein [Desulfuromonas sp. KJ2020]|uniref:vWA domain-containing protein n=1 Tax=Desulfuromonas sp. KJ2020 TaxID=2919173 RepID=UPI00273A6FC0|nr:VWA-like domain-containing protein [Desulfuromonas sp. KJ2020]